jgi:diguanylate cyclase (GGDEF)-like protein
MMAISTAWRAARAKLPEGGSLPNEIWERRHRGIVALLWLHVAGIPVYGLILGVEPAHLVMEASIVAVATLAGSSPKLNRKLRSVAATLGLFSSSAILVHLSGGLIEMHFHFFVMVAVVSLNQDWLTFLLGIGYVLIHHGLIGWLFPADVFNHPAAINQPWKWALIHAMFISAESTALLIAWRLGEEGFEDTLTKLPNSTLFVDRVAHALANSHRHSHSISVAFLDLDDFKAVNDTLGHHVGDQLLAAVAGRLAGCLRDADTAARLGGDEFALLLEATDEHEATIVADRVQSSFREPFEIEGHEVSVHASIGISRSGPDTQDADELMRNADTAMYAAKDKGKARYERFSPSMQRGDASKRLQVAAELKRAIEDQELVLQYQPIVNLHTGEIDAVEALVRWEHPNRGLTPPIDFIPVAEDTGLIVDIGIYVLRNACQQVRLWQRQFPRDPPLQANVNLCVSQLEAPSFVEDVAMLLHRCDLPPNTLILEITESVLMHDTDQTTARLNELKALGVQLAVDDFGTGYSSLSYLRGFPVDILKIDRSFVSALDEATEEDLALPRAIVALGRELNLQTIAEGIETPEQLSQIRMMLCDHAQGYYFAKPLWAEEVEQLLRKRYLNVEA